MSHSQTTPVARLYPCPRCGRDRHGLEAPCQPCAWQPPPPDRKSRQWQHQHQPDTLAWQEAQEVLAAARHVGITGLIAICWAAVVVTPPGEPLGLSAFVLLAALSVWRLRDWLRP